ncbi:MAG TPA: hypothetical protein GX517_09020 [Alicyclobacillus sp.]|nr:hypothetical protein [Alicyclobacillus sp.]
MKGAKYIARCMVEMYPSVTFEQAIEWIREYERFLVTIMEHESGYSLAEAVVSWKQRGLTVEQLEEHARKVDAEPDPSEDEFAAAAH